MWPAPNCAGSTKEPTWSKKLNFKQQTDFVFLTESVLFEYGNSCARLRTN